jgi:hypothetical protein
MMSLHDVARYADTVVFQDAHGTATFFGQILLFNDSTRSGPATKRRILDVGPNVSLPTRKTVVESLTGVTYIASIPSFDYYNGAPIRAKYPVTPADGQIHIRDIGQVLTNSGGVTDAYADLTYLRRVILEDQSSFEQGFDIYLSRYYSVDRGIIIKYDNKYYRTRQDSRPDEAGFTAVEVALIHDPVKTWAFQSKGSTYDPVDDDFSPPAAITGVSVFVETIFLDFVHEALGFNKLEPGDKAVSFLKSAVASVSVGDKIGDYQILSVSDNSTFWTIHGRK